MHEIPGRESRRQECVLRPTGQLRSMQRTCLVEKCWEIVDENTEEVVNSETFLDVNHKLLKAVLERDSLDRQRGRHISKLWIDGLSTSARERNEKLPGRKRGGYLETPSI